MSMTRDVTSVTWSFSMPSTSPASRSRRSGFRFACPTALWRVGARQDYRRRVGLEPWRRTHSHGPPHSPPVQVLPRVARRTSMEARATTRQSVAFWSFGVTTRRHSLGSGAGIVCARASSLDGSSTRSDQLWKTPAGTTVGSCRPRFQSARASLRPTRSPPLSPLAQWPGPSFRAASARDARVRARATRPASIRPARENDG